ncbi:hypothetical protein C427_2154 [Paraglaciecola psychrophila 170]|uniref:Uncharacterized protein n=1 Tax=Paraglaciecola psychrophila 170 TaxID=1129794 RepID=K7AIF1_9ALTE|nr:hypothetical protein C427_2154 [Paraglaciecola psychrophila 170]GAC40348.1 hypothetical protein GPSY_4746 [Paraglaciecola psychrophila 170]
MQLVRIIFPDTSLNLNGNHYRLHVWLLLMEHNDLAYFGMI